MILPDTNLLLYAYDSASPFHQKAASWWAGCLSGREPVGLYSAVIFAFVRIGTNPKAFVAPLGIDEASTHVESWLKQQVTQIVEMDRKDIARALELLRDAGAGGNLTSDAQLAAISLRHRAVVHTADTDFARFPEVRWYNPLLRRK
jgi:toxin-antitoxin system PIN domain toxin